MGCVSRPCEGRALAAARSPSFLWNLIAGCGDGHPQEPAPARNQHGDLEWHCGVRGRCRLAWHVNPAEAGIHTFGDFIMPVAMPAVDIVSGRLTVHRTTRALQSAGAGWTCISGDDVTWQAVPAPRPRIPGHYQPPTGDTSTWTAAARTSHTSIRPQLQSDAVVGVGMIRQLEPLNDLKPLAIAQRTMSYAAQIENHDRLHAPGRRHLRQPASLGRRRLPGGNRSAEPSKRKTRGDNRANPVDWSPARPSAFSAMRRAAVDAIASMVRGWQSSQQNFQPELLAQQRICSTRKGMPPPGVPSMRQGKTPFVSHASNLMTSMSRIWGFARTSRAP